MNLYKNYKIMFFLIRHNILCALLLIMGILRYFYFFFGKLFFYREIWQTIRQKIFKIQNANLIVYN